LRISIPATTPRTIRGLFSLSAIKNAPSLMRSSASPSSYHIFKRSWTQRASPAILS
jgi:hypothetical protein